LLYKHGTRRFPHPHLNLAHSSSFHGQRVSTFLLVVGGSVPALRDLLAGVQVVDVVYQVRFAHVSYLTPQ
jgi:hypothetical protein